MQFNRTILLSIHDVMPKTLDRVMRLIDLLETYNITTATCLVVPGCSWKTNQIDKLRELENLGYDLAGHGWSHIASCEKSLYHLIHSIIISRDAAEHLSLSSDEILVLMTKCAMWFKEKNLIVPYVYVPPAWAIGNVKWEDLSFLPFKLYETLTGIYHCEKFHHIPLVGYEADNLFRRVSVKSLNKLNKLYSTLLKKPIRVSLHPNDLELGLEK